MLVAVWQDLPDGLQLELAREALMRATSTLPEHAELLALAMESESLRDRSGSDALRLFAHVV